MSCIHIVLYSESLNKYIYLLLDDLSKTDNVDGTQKYGEHGASKEPEVRQVFFLMVQCSSDTWERHKLVLNVLETCLKCICIKAWMCSQVWWVNGITAFAFAECVCFCLYFILHHQTSMISGFVTNKVKSVKFSDLWNPRVLYQVERLVLLAVLMDNRITGGY